ncbi:hypothetical protein LTR95_010936, partial [Oleoguttula sp. CCFEE 5521]
MVQPERAVRSKHDVARTAKHYAGSYKAVGRQATRRLKAVTFTYHDNTVSVQTLAEHEHWSAKIIGDDAHLLLRKSHDAMARASTP